MKKSENGLRHWLVIYILVNLFGIGIITLVTTLFSLDKGTDFIWMHIKIRSVGHLILTAVVVTIFAIRNSSKR